MTRNVKHSGKGRKGSGSGSQTTMHGWQLPLLTPTVSWTAPRLEDLPDLRRLSKNSLIGVDTETRDPRLESHGPGGFRKDGEIVGVSIATETNEFPAFYIPLRHASGGNMENPDKALEWLRYMLAGEQPKVGHNVLYDMEMLAVEGINLGGNLYDTSKAEALLDEWRFRYDLDSVAKTHLGRGKNEAGLRDAAIAYGVDPKAGLHLLPAGHVGPYATDDAILCREILPKQWRKLQAEGLIDVFKLECELLHVLLEMRRRGVRVDLDKAAQLRQTFLKQEAELQRELDSLTNLRTDVWAPKDLVRLCVGEGIKFPMTIKGNPSFEGEWLERHSSSALQLVAKIRTLSKSRRDFVESMVMDHACRVDGKNTGYIHSTFKPLKDDDGGAKHGRFASSDPNLQQVPKRDEYIGPLIRGLFIPEDGEIWAACDYSAQEPRFQDHLAILHQVRGWQVVKAAYDKNPKLDRHQWVTDLMGNRYPRKTIKVLNLSISYGGGIPTITAQLGCSPEEAKSMMDLYYQSAPFVKALQKKYSDEAQTGHLELMFGRRCRFPFWEPADAKYGTYYKPLHRRQAEEAYPGKRLRRCYAHKGLNRMVQGSCSYQTKTAMLNAYKAGIITQLPVHDELSGSRKSPDEAKMLGEIMRDAVKLTVPTMVDVKLGKSWGECE